MSIIKSVILDEYDRNKRMQQTYIQELANFPRGSITRKCIRGRYYYYWMYRENGKVINKYISGKSNKIDELQSQVEKRKQVEQLIRNLKAEQLEMERYLRGTEHG